MPGPTFTTGQIAQLLDAELLGPDDLTLSTIAGLDEAQPGALTFIRSGKFAGRWQTSHASAAIVTSGIGVTGHDAERRALLIVPDADAAMIAVLGLVQQHTAPPPPEPGIHETAHVDAHASVDALASIGPLCVIGAHTSIGPGCVLHPRVTIGRGVTLRSNVTLHPGVTIYDGCTIGEGCVIHAGAVIGADGFGYHPHPDGSGLVKVPHLAAVTIGRDVEIGANACIDRGKLADTTVGDGSKIDNLAQIGHSCRIGRGAIICGQVGLAGSVVVGDGAVLGGQVGVGDNLRVGAGTKVGAQTGIAQNLRDGVRAWGTPALEGTTYARAMMFLPKMRETVAELRQRIDELEQSQAERTP
ncbi:MAG: UDP-3-O-(3-hydroxymyristoyl)glucosamine N-acyltransferase [Planctomycetota bacterium]